MGHFTNIVRNATDTNKNKDNAVLGKYEIASRHGKNVWILDIYEVEKKGGFKTHIATFKIGNSNTAVLLVSDSFKQSPGYKEEIKLFEKFVVDDYGGSAGVNFEIKEL